MRGADASEDVLAVAGGKGGCGKTTTTLGVAMAAARLGGSVLAVDADLDVPDLHRLAGLEHPHRQGDERPDGPSDDAGGEPAVEPRPVPGARGAAVLPARPGGDPATLADRLPGRGDHDAVLVDCPAGAGPDVAHPLETADRALLVTTADRPALHDAAKTAAMAHAVDTPVVGAVVTATDDPPDGVADLLATDRTWAVPQVEAPLRSTAARRQYAAVARGTPVLRQPQTF